MKIDRLTLTLDIQTDACDWDALLDSIRDTPGVILATVKTCKQLYPPVENTQPQDSFYIPVPTPSDQLVYKGHDADGNSVIEACKDTAENTYLKKGTADTVWSTDPFYGVPIVTYSDTVSADTTVVFKDKTK